MEDKYLYMKHKNKCLPYLILDGKQYIFNYLISDPVRKNDEKSSKSKFGENTGNLFCILMEFSMKTALLMKKELSNTMILIVRIVSQMI